MKSITTYIKEDLDIDNLFWKIQVFFKRKPEEYNKFVKIVQQCQEDTTVTVDNLDTYTTKAKLDVKKLIDFLDDDIGGQKEKDYLYLLKKVIETINNDKTIEM